MYSTELALIDSGIQCYFLIATPNERTENRSVSKIATYSYANLNINEQKTF